MTNPRRVVRATGRFFEDLDRQLADERGPEGSPSANDFQVFDLLRIFEIFATEFDLLPRLIAERPDYRLLVGVGVVVSRFAVAGQIVSDGAVELVQLDIDSDGDWTGESS